MKKRDRLRDFIVLCQEGYILAASPPCFNPARATEPIERDDPNQFARAYLLRLSIDVKWIVANLLVKLPKRRAEILHAWIQDDTDYSWARLTYAQRKRLERDRATLADRLRAGVGR